MSKKRMHIAGVTTTQDLIADTLRVHPEMIKVTDEPINMMIKYNEDGTAYLLHASDEEINNGEFWALLHEDIIECNSGCIVKDSDMVFLLHRNDNEDMIMDEIVVYKNAHMSKVKREFDAELARLGHRKGSWAELEDNNPDDVDDIGDDIYE